MRRNRAVAILALLATAPLCSAQTAEHAPRWSLDAGAQELYYTNGQADASSGDFVTRIDTRLGRRFPSRRGAFELAADAGLFIDHTVGQLRRVTWGLAASGSRALSRRSRLQGTVGSSLGYARDVSRLEETGAVPPYALTRTDMASVSLRQALPGAVQGRFEARGERYQFDSPELVNGSSGGVDAELSRGLGPRLYVRGSGSYTRSSSRGRRVEIGGVSGAVGVLPVRDVTITLQGGVSRYRALDEEASHLTPTGGVTGTGRFGHHTVSAGLAQGVEQAYGLGTIGVVRTASADYIYALGTRLAFNAGVNDSRVSEVVVGAGPGHTRRLSTGVRYDIVRGLSGEIQYSYWWRSAGLDEWRSQSLSVSLRTHFAWR